MTKSLAGGTGGTGDEWIPFRVFYEFARSRGFEFMRRKGDLAVFVNRLNGRVFIVQVVNGMVRKDDYDEFDFFSSKP